MSEDTKRCNRMLQFEEK